MTTLISDLKKKISLDEFKMQVSYTFKMAY